jgi:hypothetical protein
LLTGLVHAEYGERITVPRFEYRVERAIIDRREQMRKLHLPMMELATSRNAKHGVRRL